MIEIKDKESCITAIKLIGKDLIDRAEDICNDLIRVSSITIQADIKPLEIVNYDIKKNYSPKFEDSTD
jgi:hypothetical protein